MSPPICFHFFGGWSDSLNSPLSHTWSSSAQNFGHGHPIATQHQLPLHSGSIPALKSGLWSAGHVSLRQSCVKVLVLLTLTLLEHFLGR